MPIIDLEKEKIADGFQIPNGYFDDIEDVIFQKIYLDEKKIKQKNRWRIFAFSAAASVLIVLGLFLLIPQNDYSKAQNDPRDEEQKSETEMLFEEMDHIEETLLAYSTISDEQALQINHDLDQRVEMLEEMINEEKLQDEDYQILDYYLEEVLFDIYF